MPRLAALALAAAALAFPTPAGATLSVLAVDPESRAIGAVIASCVGDEFHLSNAVAIDAAHGGVIAQSYFATEGRDRLLELLTLGRSPADALAEVANASFDPEEYETGFSLRQYAAVDFAGRSATFTGTGAFAYAESRQDATRNVTFTVQGNYLTGPGVLDALESGMSQGDVSLGRRLVAALRAVVEAGVGGDQRCAPHVSDAAYFELHDGHGAPLALHVVTDASHDAALDLVTQVEAALDTREGPPPATNAPSDATANDIQSSEDGPSCAVTQGNSGSATTALFAACFSCLGLSLAWRRRGRSRRGSQIPLAPLSRAGTCGPCRSRS
jgi:uncharacterized Ntn-hydrolase superfamily protein